MLNHKYSRFKAIGRTDFWLLLPASYCHITCKSDNIEWSQGHSLPRTKDSHITDYILTRRSSPSHSPNLHPKPRRHQNRRGPRKPNRRHETLRRMGGEQNLDLEGYTDIAWLENFYEVFREDGVDEMFISIDPTPVERRKMWKKYVGAKQISLVSGTTSLISPSTSLPGVWNAISTSRIMRVPPRRRTAKPPIIA